MRNSIKVLVVMVFLLVLSMLMNHVLAEEIDSDLDGIPDSSDKYPFDYDNDGMPDIWEKKNGLRYDSNDAEDDYDNDGIKNIDEYKQGTNPLISDKTKEIVEQQILLAPVERTMARGLIWAVAGFFLLLILIFVLYRTHIFRIFKFMHHVSKEHFEKEKGRGLYGPTPVYSRRRVLPPRHIPPQRFVQYPKRVFVQRPIIKEEVLRPAVKEAAREIKEGGDLEKRERVLEKGYTQKPSVKEEIIVPNTLNTAQSLGKVQTKEEIKRDVDVFGKLSEHINNYKQLKGAKTV